MKRLGILIVLALAAPQAAMARGTFDPTTEFEQHEWVPIHLGPLNLSITKAVVYLMIGTALTILLGVTLMRAKKPGRRQALGEQIYEIAQTQVAEQGLPTKAIGRWFPYVATLMLFIWVVNIIGFIPLAAHRRALARRADLGHLRSDVVALGDARARAAHLRLHTRRGHPLERAGEVLQELDPRGAEAAARADRAARGARPVHAAHLAERQAIREHARGSHPDPHVHRPALHPAEHLPGRRRRSRSPPSSTCSRS